MTLAILRVARPTDNLKAFIKMYMDGLGFKLLGGFEVHDGYRVILQNGEWSV